jgi:hypothetical protein
MLVVTLSGPGPFASHWSQRWGTPLWHRQPAVGSVDAHPTRDRGASGLSCLWFQPSCNFGRTRLRPGSESAMIFKVLRECAIGISYFLKFMRAAGTERSRTHETSERTTLDLRVSLLRQRDIGRGTESRRRRNESPLLLRRYDEEENRSEAAGNNHTAKRCRHGFSSKSL